MGRRIIEAVGLRDSSGPLLRFIGLCFDWLAPEAPARSECTHRRAEDAFSDQNVSETKRPFEKPKHRFSIRRAVRFALGGTEPGLPRYVGSKLSDAVSRGRKPITSPPRKQHARVSVEELSARTIAGGQDRQRNESPRR